MEAPVSSVKPDRILRELADLWITTAKPADGAHAQSESGGVLRACSMTLVALVDDEENASELGETIAMLMRGHPSRAIVVRICEGKDRLESRVFQQCWMPFGQRRQICCEQVEITASADHLCDIPSIVEPLAVPDLPSVLWLRSKRVCEGGDYVGLLALGGKLILDSSRMGASAFQTLTGFLNAGHVTGDLAWTRLTELRQLIAQLFYQYGDQNTPRTIRIQFTGTQPKPEAKYLWAWLTDALPGISVSLDGGGAGETPIAVIRMNEDTEIDLRPNGAEYRTGSLKQTAKFKSGSDFDLLDEELGITVHDRIFEQALRKVAA
jgi:glucose-6-phosphate dehydrogenase assembly protein OpcA